VFELLDRGGEPREDKNDLIEVFEELEGGCGVLPEAHGEGLQDDPRVKVFLLVVL